MSESSLICCLSMVNERKRAICWERSDANLVELPAIVMEMAEGGTIAEVLRSRDKPIGKLQNT